MPEYQGKHYELFTMYAHPIPIELRQPTPADQITVGRSSLKGETYSFRDNQDRERFCALWRASVPVAFHDEQSIAMAMEAAERDCNASRARNPNPDLIYSCRFGPGNKGNAIFNLGRMQHDEFARYVQRHLDYFLDIANERP